MRQQGRDDVIIDTPNHAHLTYCLNVHPGERFADQWDAAKRYALAVRSALGCEDRPFGLGLRLGAGAVNDLHATDAGTAFHAWCRENGFYVFTINGFPYGAFHRTRVKADVYRPDWTTSERLDYTIALADLLAAWLPEGAQGSISTVPLWYEPDRAGHDRAVNMDRAVSNLAACAAHLHALYEKTGRDICLALEPEPWCALDCCDDVLAFFANDGAALDRDRIGVCVDTCHCALAFEEPADVMRRLREAGVRIGKIQLSAALSAPDGSEEAAAALAPFVEPVYFHQTAQRSGGSMRRWPDLPDALPEIGGSGEVRVHFHVPLQWGGSRHLASTRDNMDDAFWRLVRKGPCRHLEIETYTFDVLPAEVGLHDLAASIEAEYRWVLDKS